ncbi:MAG TPA: hypothetical protein VJM12_12655, partial [Pyrinomonadaceae bacterium]|nr:hypothetical protein [Pyrinomonadaceae bacterium]
WILIWFNARQNNLDFWESLSAMPPSITVIPETAWRWGNAVSTLLVPQRGMLMGLPLAVIVFTQWWIAAEDAGKGGRGDSEKRKDAEKGRRKQKNLRVPVSPHHRVPLFVSPIRKMIAAGFIAGLLPLVHAHSFVVVIIVAACLALGWHARAWILVGSTLLLFTVLFVTGFPVVTATPLKVLFVLAAALAVALCFVLPRAQRNLWYAFFIAAIVIAGPQLWWSTHASAVDSASFFAFEFGWDSAKERFFGLTLVSDSLQSLPRLRIVLERLPDVAWFWFKNTGLFIPLILIAIFWRGKKPLIERRLLYFYLPFTLCFIVPNFVKLAPWVWDNIKVLYYWWLASAPLVAVLLVRLWREGWAPRVLALALFVCVILAGSLDVGSIVFKSAKYQIFDRAGIQFAETVKQQTAPRELIIHAPVHNHPIFLTGRRSLMGYPGHIWTHGLDFVQREAEIKQFYIGSANASGLPGKYGISKAVVSPLERNFAKVNEQFFSRFQTVGAVGEYQLYQIAP